VVGVGVGAQLVIVQKSRRQNPCQRKEAFGTY
jgi:hypothetical protein